MDRIDTPESFQPRTIQADVKKDVEFFGFLPMMAIAIGLPVFILSIICAGLMFYFFGMGVLGFLILCLFPALSVIIFFKADVPWRFKKALMFKVYNKKNDLTLNDLHDIKRIDGPFITYSDNSKAVLLEYETGTAWENTTFDTKYDSIKAFSMLLPSILKEKKIELSIFATVSKEDSSIFIAKRKSLRRCKTPEIRKMTEARVEFHAEIENRETTKTVYVMRLRTLVHQNDDEKAMDLLRNSLKIVRGYMEKSSANIVLYGKDMIEEYIEKQLIPLSPKIRGKAASENKKGLNLDIKSWIKDIKKALWPIS